MKINPSEIRSAQFIDTYFPIVDGVVQTVHNYAELMNRSGYACVVTPKPLKKEYDDSDLIYEVYRTALIGLPVAEYGMPAPKNCGRSPARSIRQKLQRFLRRKWKLAQAG